MFQALRKPFAVTRLANAALIPLLKSKAGRRLGGRLAVVEYLGRRSGQPRRLVTQYAVEGRTVRIGVGSAERKTWWRNFDGGHPLLLWLAGVEYAATAQVVRAGGLVSVVAELDVPGADAGSR